MLRMLRTCSLILAATALAACGSPAINYYVLDVEPGPRIATTNTLSIEIIDVSAQYLERFQLDPHRGQRPALRRSSSGGR